MRPFILALSLVAVTARAWAQADMSIKGCRSNLDCPLDPSSGSEEACCCTAPYDFQIPGTYAQCQFTAICDYPIIQGSCCCPDYFDGCPSGQCDAWTQLVNVYNNPNDPYGMFAAPGDCVPPPPGSNGLCASPKPPCADSELTDDYLGSVNLRTGCVSAGFPVGSLEIGNVLSLDVSIIFNESRPPPKELALNATNPSTGPYGVGGWLSVDRIFTDEGVYWDNTGTMQGTRGDRNKNGYIGFTLHTPLGSRTYDYPTVVNLAGYAKPVGVYRSEPFDGYFLMVSDPADGSASDRRYTLFRYPNGPYEIYDWGLAAPLPLTGFDKTNPLRTASLLRFIQGRFGPPGDRDDSFDLKQLKIFRGPGGKVNHEVFGISGTADATRVFALFIGRQGLADGGMKVIYTRADFAPAGAPLPQDLQWTMTLTKAKNFRPETFTRPGRQANDTIGLDWNDWRLKTVDVQMFDGANKPIYEDSRAYNRDKNNAKIFSIVSTETLEGNTTGDKTIYYENCGIDGKPFPASVVAATTVSMPGNVRRIFEYGDASAQNRLVAQTNEMGVRTQFKFNDQNTEPRYELTDQARVAAPTADAATLAQGLGVHVDWTQITQNPVDATLFPGDAFVNAPAAVKGTPVLSKLTRLPDSLVLATLSDYDASVFQPKTIVDQRGMTQQLTYYSDTAQMKTHTRQGVTIEYQRSFITDILADLVTQRARFLQMDTWLKAGAYSALVDRSAWDHAGRFFRLTKIGWKVLPESPTTGDIVRTTIHKRLIRSVFGAPITLRTYIDDVLVAESAVGWDPRYQAPSTATSKLTAGTQLGNVKPNGGKIDGLGTPTGDWQSNGLAQQRATSVDLDPTGGTKKVTVNGTGDKTTYGQGGDARTLKISNSAVSKNIGETPEADIFETAGTTKALCP